MNDELTIILEPLKRITGQQSGAIRDLAQVSAGLSALWAKMDLRLAALEAERSGRTVMHKDVLTIHARIRERAANEAPRNGLNAKGESIMRAELRKSLLKRYGIRDLHDLPANKLDEALAYTDGVPVFRILLKVRQKLAES